MSHIDQGTEIFEECWDDERSTYKDEEDRLFRELYQLHPLSEWLEPGEYDSLLVEIAPTN